ncbi:ABC transporter ATP-binding protein [Methanospirillum stamsii]|uniref:ABC transporter n=1 Tax=Methanospirillum stamsii TaxID=1277351 RepID=A0A2V2MPF8_9EURY|nr:ABC transporter ATP-binding protein/permease [Methanospirillum stamsii]PWR70104.1 ABC transporter [Methanospirillum stamsii]
MVTFKEYLHQLRFFIQGYEHYLFFLLILSIIIGLIDAGSIALLYPMISVGFQISADSIPFYGVIDYISSLIPMGSQFVHLGLLFIILTATSLCLQLAYWKVAFIFQRELIVKTKQSIFSKIDSNDYKFFIDSRQGDLLNLFNQSPHYVQQTYDRLLSFCTDLMTSILVIMMLFLLSPGGLILVLIGGGIFYLIINSISKNISEKLGNLQIASGQSENKVINEYITGIKPIKALHASENWKRQYIEALKLYWSKFAEFMFIQRIPIIAINSLFYITIGVIVLVLYVYYADNFLEIIPVLGTFAAGMMKILPKSMNMGTYKLELKNYLPHVSIIYSIFQEEKYHSLVNGERICKAITSDIILHDVNFSYGHAKILNDVSMTIEKGSMTGLVGHSGSGKSTIASLLLRLYDPGSGRIIVNDFNLKEYDVNTYRDLVGYVSQDPFMFNASIRENILFGGIFSDIEIIEAAKLAYVHEFIMELPEGYDTLVGDQGITLSGGEKQRIVIARAMIRRPEFLILDEATSALDNISEAAVQKAIDQVTKECTTLVIAHRLTTIRNADKIVVIEKGRIVEEGKHEDLLERRGKYWEMSKARAE